MGSGIALFVSRLNRPNNYSKGCNEVYVKRRYENALLFATMLNVYSHIETITCLPGLNKLVLSRRLCLAQGHNIVASDESRTSVPSIPRYN